MRFLNGNCLLCKIQNKVVAAACACERGIQLWFQSWTECERFDTGGAFQCKNKLCRKCELCLGAGFELQLLSAWEELWAPSDPAGAELRLPRLCWDPGSFPRPTSQKGKGNCWSCHSWACRTVGPSSIQGTAAQPGAFHTCVPGCPSELGAASSSDGNFILQ